MMNDRTIPILTDLCGGILLNTYFIFLLIQNILIKALIK